MNIPSLKRIKPEIEKVSLIKIAKSVSSLLLSIEPDFLLLGEQLNESYSESQKLSDLVLGTVSLVGDKKEDSHLNNISAVANQAVQTLKDSQANITGFLGILKNGGDNLNILANSCSQADKLSMLLNVITLNIGVESCRSQEATEMFQVFIKEISELSGKIKSVSETLAEDAIKEQKSQGVYHRQLAKKLSELKGLTDDSDDTVKKSVQEINKLIKTSLVSLENGAQHSNTIGQKIGEVVMAIQFHDIIRQKLEHVSESLIEVGGKIDGKKENNLTEDEKQIIGILFSTIKVQKIQIEHVIDEVDEAYNKITNAYDVIDKESYEMANSLSKSITTDSKAQEDDGFGRVVGHLKQLNPLLARSASIDRQIETAARSASDSIKGMSSHIKEVQQISLDLHRKALNAVIKSSHLGKLGLALEVLSQEVTKSSHDLDQFSGTVSRIIQTIIDAVNKFETVSIKTSQGQDSEINHSVLFENAIEKISQDYHLFSQNSLKALEISREFANSLTKVRSHLSFMVNFSEDLKTQCGHLDEILSQIPEVTPIEPQQNSENKIYTMESERLIHSMVFKDLADAALSREEDDKDEDEDEDNMGGELELFDMDLEDTDPEFQAPHQDDGVLKEEPDEKKPEEKDSDDKKETEKEEDFGDNVDLF